MNLGHHKLKAWQEAIELVIVLYKMTDTFPKSETYGLTSQIRRAVVSIPSNIAEGAGRKSKNEFLYHLHVARGSLGELDTLVIISRRLGYSKASDSLDQQMNKVFSLISGLITSLGKEGDSQ